MAAEGGNKLLPTARRKGHREMVGKGEWDEVEQLGCTSINEVGENGGKWPCRL